MSPKRYNWKPFNYQGRTSPSHCRFKEMKHIILILVLLLGCFQTRLLGQSCSNIYVFSAADKISHAVISKDILDDEIIARGRAAAVQTYELPINWAPSQKSATLHVQGLFDCSSNLESRDFVWIYFSFNGKKVKTVTVNGISGKTNMRILDSLHVPFGTKVTMRAAMVCDQPDEFIALKNGYLELCQVVDASNAASNNDLNTDMEDIEPQMQISNINEKVKLVWKSGANYMPNFFKLERTDGNGSWEVAGFVKDQCQKQTTCEYVFIDISPKTSTVGYRIMRVDQKGKEFLLTEEARPVN
jgi:hypothetical protein